MLLLVLGLLGKSLVLVLVGRLRVPSAKCAFLGVNYNCRSATYNLKGFGVFSYSLNGFGVFSYSLKGLPVLS